MYYNAQKRLPRKLIMAQFRFKSDDIDEVRPDREIGMREESKVSAAATNFMSFFVRLMGIFMLLVGLWIGVKVITEVWGLYRGPQHIERFADAIDRGSNLDKVLANFSSRKPARAKEREVLVEETKAPEKQNESLRISYFIAWIIVILLLMLIGRLALAAIKTGGELALYDLQVKRFARLLMEEVRDPEKRKK